MGDRSTESLARVSYTNLALIALAGANVCAVPVQYVLEHMRALPIEPIVGAPSFVRGVSVVRGNALPVIDLTHLLAGSIGSEIRQRFITLNVEHKQFVLAVDRVVGLKSLEQLELCALPPLLGNSAIIESLAVLDARLLLVLKAARLVPDAVWATLLTGAEHG